MLSKRLGDHGLEEAEDFCIFCCLLRSYCWDGLFIYS
jgi:hypothetical protein